MATASPGLAILNALQKIRHKWQQIHEAVAMGDQNHNGDIEIGKILLVLKIPINREEDVKLGSGQSQESAVSFARLALLCGRHGFMAGHFALQPMGQTFIKQDTHN